MTPPFRVFLAIVILGTLAAWGVSRAADYTRDGGTADWMCCEDKACTVIISQHADPVRAEKACEKLTDADGKIRYTRSNAFRITPVVVTNGTASVFWSAPAQNTDGSPLTDLAGFRIIYGTSATQLDRQVEVANPAAVSHTVTGLAPGTWFFAVVAYNSAGASSEDSNVASKIIA
jgi:hypothetical protein